jgi:hypothetical protein
MNGPISETASWTHQYQVTFASNPTAGGTANPGTGWYSSGSLSISATPNAGYKWTSWRSTGSIIINGQASSTTATVSGSGTITANFVPNQLSVDGLAYAGNGTHGSPTLTLTTAQANDVIILQITQDHDHNFSPSDSAGLNWQERTDGAVGDSNEEVDEWWAVASSPLSNDVISLGESGSSSYNTVAIAFGISGANTLSPFDSNSGLPRTRTGTSGTPTVTGVSTSNANDIIIGLVGYRNNATGETAAAGYTLIASQTYGTGSSQQWGAAEYKIVSSTQSSVSVSWGVNLSSNDWAMIADAIAQQS